MVGAKRKITERDLIETLERIAVNKAAYSALYISISKLKPKNRHQSFVKIIARLFDDLTGAANGTMFVLSNSDFVLLGSNVNANMVETAVKKLRIALGNDPILYATDINEFARLYEFPDDYDELLTLIKTMENNLATGGKMSKYPVDAGLIDGIIEQLNSINVTELVKHQSVIRIEGAGKFSTLFQEFFVAVKDLSRKYDTYLDLTANKWLFFYLTQILDKKTMSSFMFADIKNKAEMIGLNLNLSSIFSSEFVNFAKTMLEPKQKLVAEVLIADVFNNLHMYFEAKEILHQGGHKILIDATTTEMLHMINISRLQPDMVKIFWDPLMILKQEDEDLKQIIAELGADNVILAKCRDEKALRWGMSNGIGNFQGPYIDKLETAIIKAGCPNAKKCSNEDCLKRRRLIAGDFRDECEYKEFLEKIIG